MGENVDFPPYENQTSVLSIWMGYRINWIISEVQGNNFFFIFLASKKLLAPLRSKIGTGSVICHSFSVSPGVVKDVYDVVSAFTKIKLT